MKKEFVIKIKSYEVILDDETMYNLITLPVHSRKKVRRKIFVDDSNLQERLLRTKGTIVIDWW